MEQRPFITCRQLIELIAGHVAGELDETSGNDFARHLAACDSCLSYLETYRRTMSLIRLLADDPEAPRNDVPADLVRTILARRA